MKFELLPNEILIECFEYLNGPDIFYSFDQSKNHFYKFIRNIPYSQVSFRSILYENVIRARNQTANLFIMII